jgi:hypothetical protein
MPVPTSITDLSTTASSNFPADTDSTGGTVAELPRQLSAIIKKQFVNASPITIVADGSVSIPDEGSYVVINGTGFTISGFDDCFDGRVIRVKFAESGLELTHSAGFSLPTGDDVTTVAGDTATFVNESTGAWRCISYPQAINRLIPTAPDIPSGTKMLFMQASAPTGWTIDTSFNDRMLYINTGSGGATGGSHNPLVMDVVPSHTHTATTTASQSAHAHTLPTYSGTSGTGGRITGALNNGAVFSAVATDAVAPAISASTTVNANSGSNWTPKYATAIVCSKD